MLSTPGVWQSAGWLRAIGLSMIGAALACLALCQYSTQRQLSWRPYRLVPASGRLAAWQAAFDGANWLLIGVIVWGLLGGRVDYATVLGVMLVAAVAGVVTHVTANLGVFEAVVVASLGALVPKSELLAAVLAYPATYDLLAFTLALPAYGLNEAAARRSDRRTRAGAEPPRTRLSSSTYKRLGTCPSAGARGVFTILARVVSTCQDPRVQPPRAAKAAQRPEGDDHEHWCDRSHA